MVIKRVVRRELPSLDDFTAVSVRSADSLKLNCPGNDTGEVLTSRTKIADHSPDGVS